MGILDIVVIAIALIFILIGVIRGFSKGVFGALGGILSLVGAYFLCGVVGGWLIKSSLGTTVTEKIVSWFASKGPEFTVVHETITNEVLTGALTALKIPSFLHGMIIGVMDLSNVQNVSIAGFLAPNLARVGFIGASFVVLFLVIRLVCFILSKLFSKGIHKSGLGFIDRLLGLAVGAAKAALVIWGIFLIVSLLSSLPFFESINTWITNDMQSKAGIAKFLYDNNPLALLIAKIFPSK